MKLIEQIKADRKAGSDGPWSAFTDDTSPHTNIVSVVPNTAVVFSLPGRCKSDPDIQRVCRVPVLEEIALAAEECASAIEDAYSFIFDEYYQPNRDDCECLPVEAREPVRVMTEALATFRKALESHNG